MVADLHIHSRFARACSKALTVPALAATAAIKGINILGTGDFLHPAWFAELRRDLEEAEPGLYQPKIQNSEFRIQNSVRFMLTTEVSCIYSKGGRVRRVHHLIFVSSFQAVERLREALEKRGAKLRSDGRPIIGLDSKELLHIVLELGSDAMLVPAHVWTPWFAVFGSKSGFDTLEECFDELTPHIAAVETGLSSDPPMNWRLSMLDHVALLSNSDAHSLPNLGREANIFELEALSYQNIIQAIRNSSPKKLVDFLSHVPPPRRGPAVAGEGLPKDRIVSTIEFYPEEGMYHVDGHRACTVSFKPSETKKHHGLCPRCRLPLTIGVLNRVETLADRPEGFRPKGAPDFLSLVELDKIIAESLGIGSRASKKVQEVYGRVVAVAGSELAALMDTPYVVLERAVLAHVVEGIRRVRERRLSIEPGFDGQYGRVSIFSADERKQWVGAEQEALTLSS